MRSDPIPDIGSEMDNLWLLKITIDDLEDFIVYSNDDGSYRMIGIGNGYHYLNISKAGYNDIQNKGVTI